MKRGGGKDSVKKVLKRLLEKKNYKTRMLEGRLGKSRGTNKEGIRHLDLL